jgi:hypothetical protein
LDDAGVDEAKGAEGGWDALVAEVAPYVVAPSADEHPTLTIRAKDASNHNDRAFFVLITFYTFPDGHEK